MLSLPPPPPPPPVNAAETRMTDNELDALDVNDSATITRETLRRVAARASHEALANHAVTKTVRGIQSGDTPSDGTPLKRLLSQTRGFRTK